LAIGTFEATPLGGVFATSISSRIDAESAGIDQSIAATVGVVASKAFISRPETPLVSHHDFAGSLQPSKFESSSKWWS